MYSGGPIVQWSFLQYKRTNKKTSAPVACFSQSFTQIGSKMLLFGGCNDKGEALSQLFIYDTQNYEWSEPANSIDFQESHPGARYSHSATLVDMHPPRLMIFGGVISGGTYEFDSPDSAIEPSKSSSFLTSKYSNRKGIKKDKMQDEYDDGVYFLELDAEKWGWSKPLILGSRSSRPVPRSDHSASKTNTNEVSVFGGYTQANEVSNELWTFNFVDMEWKLCVTSGIQPKPRHKHTSEVIGRKLVIFGGSDNAEDSCEGARHLAFHVLNLETMQWSHPSLSGMNPFPRSGHTTAVIGANLVAVFGGRRSNNLIFNDLNLIDVTSNTVTTVNAVEAHLPTPVYGASVSAVGNRCFVFGGVDNEAECYNDIRSIDIGEYLDANDVTVAEGSASDYCFKILIIGDSGVGKSALLTRFSDNTFIPSFTATIGIDFNTKLIRVDKAICKLEIWDTAGQERFATITANYYRGAQGAMLVYDVSSKDSFDHVKSWYDRAKMLGGADLECVLIGNKIDIATREVFFEDGAKLASDLGIAFVETSALSGSNVEQAFVTMTSNIKVSLDKRNLTGISENSMKSSGGVQLSTTEEKKSKCCA